MYYTPYSARMSPENTHKLMGFIWMLFYFSTWFLLLLAVSYRVKDALDPALITWAYRYLLTEDST